MAAVIARTAGHRILAISSTGRDCALRTQKGPLQGLFRILLRQVQRAASYQGESTYGNRSMSSLYRFYKRCNRHVCNSNNEPYIRHDCGTAMRFAATER